MGGSFRAFWFWNEIGHFPVDQGIMEKVLEYRRHAEECRGLASQVIGQEIKAHYEALADMWAKLAEERLTFFVQDAAGPLDGS